MKKIEEYFDKNFLIEPQNHESLVALFGQIYPLLGFQNPKIRREYPDCIAQREGKEVKIEFEYLSSNFNHQDFSKCDIIVCWIHDKPSLLNQFEIIELLPIFKSIRSVLNEKKFMDIIPEKDLVLTFPCIARKGTIHIENNLSDLFELGKRSKVVDLNYHVLTRKLTLQFNPEIMEKMKRQWYAIAISENEL